MPYVRWWISKDERAKGMKLHQILFGYRVPPKYQYRGLFGNGGKPDPTGPVKQVARGFYEVSEESKKDVERILEDIGIKRRWF